MSDTAQGPGWWQASDGKWYPPESRPAGAVATAAPPPDALKKKSGCLKFGLIALAVLVVIGVIAAIAGGGGGDDVATTNDTTPGATAAPGATTGVTAAPSKATLFPGRPDAQSKDREANIGQAVEFSGYTTKVNKAGFQQQLSDFERKGYIVANVTITNRDKKAQPYNVFDWKLQTSSGQVLNGAFTTRETLGSGDLVTGGTVTGDIVFEIGAQKGDFYLIYKPDAFNADRGIWKVTV